MVANIEIIVGTYEEFLLGYKLETKDEKPVLTQSFADKAHSGAIKCLAVQSHWIASGSTDDRIFIYDMRARKQTEILLVHEGTINALSFAPDNTHLFSGGDDGKMIATQVGNWKTTATWKKAHGGSALTHISCHPSGKLALSLGTDLILCTWNLVKGRVAYKSNLKSRNSLGRVADCLAWSPTGDYFSLTGQRVVEIWSIEKADVVHSQKTASKPISICWISDETCLVGLEDGKIIWVTLQDEKEKLFEAHTARIKAMTVFDSTLVTASSSGDIKVWQINMLKKNLKEIAACNIGCRPTCVGILNLSQFGSDYKIITESDDTKATVSKVVKNTKPPQGVVTVEYENDESEQDDSPDDKDASQSDSSNEAEQSSNNEESADEVNEEIEEEVSSSEDSSEKEVTKKSKKRKAVQKLKNAKKQKQFDLKKTNKNVKKNISKSQKSGFKQKNK